MKRRFWTMRCAEPKGKQGKVSGQITHRAHPAVYTTYIAAKLALVLIGDIVLGGLYLN